MKTNLEKLRKELLDEAKQLEDKIYKLNKMIFNEWNNPNLMDISLLKEQSTRMCEYQRILIKRIESIDNELSNRWL